MTQLSTQSGVPSPRDLQEHAYYDHVIVGVKPPGKGTEVLCTGRVRNREGNYLRTVSRLGEVSAPCAMVNICERA